MMRSRATLFFTMLLFLSGMALPATAQNCTHPNGVLGDMIFNDDHDSFQGCTTRGWVAFHDPASMPPDCPNPGDTCSSDSTIYAGQVGGVKIYTTAADQAAVAYYGTRSFVTGEVSLTDGLTNTNNLYAHIMAGDGTFNPPPDAAPNRSPNATIICHDLVAHGYSDWYLPADQELQEMLSNSVAIGGFTENSYWSSTEHDLDNALNRWLPDAIDGISSKTFGSGVRCVRR